MSFRRGMLGERQDTTTWQRLGLFALALAVALGGPAFADPEPSAIRMGAAPTVASAADAVSGDEGSVPASPLTAASFRDIWAASTTPTWRQGVQYVQPPEGITAGEPLMIEVHAVDPSGRPLSNALVEITWELPGLRYQEYGRTNPFGRMSSRRLLPRESAGKRCVVAVRVSRDDLEASAYSAFVPK
jgi:hypothetical protein